MKVVFISRSNIGSSPGSLVANQSDSLGRYVKITHVLVRQEGVLPYLAAIRELKSRLRRSDHDLIHAHYGMCGLAALLCFPKIPVIVSFMGSDLHGGKISNLNSFFNYLLNKAISIVVATFADHLIVKSERLAKNLTSRRKVSIIPNGVDINRFFPIPRKVALSKLDIRFTERFILFLGDPNNHNKNHSLLVQAVKLLGDSVKIVSPYPLMHELVPLYLNACEVLVVTSFFEGSPNVIKEAMACNCPIVSTDTGDAKLVMSNCTGSYITGYVSSDVSKKISLALDFAETEGRTNGRTEIIRKGLDSDSIAKRIVSVYNSISITNKSNQ